MIKKSRAIFALTTLLVIIFQTEPLIQFGAVEANPYNFFDELNHPNLRFYSPSSRHSGYSSYANPVVYTKPSFNISFDYLLPNNFTQVDSFSYKIDNNPTYSLNSTRENGTRAVKYSVFKTIDNLDDGIYNLKVYALFVNGTTSQIKDCNIKIDTMFANPYLPLFIASLALIILVVSTVIFYSRKFIGKILRGA
jgi:hypothetical protein